MIKEGGHIVYFKYIKNIFYVLLNLEITFKNGFDFLRPAVITFTVLL